jgi:hypothetical protein
MERQHAQGPDSREVERIPLGVSDPIAEHLEVQQVRPRGAFSPQREFREG